MFFLISSNNPDQRCVILGGKVYIVGRQNCDILLPGDQTVSRKHAELTVSHTEANLTNMNKLPILKLKDISKFGTWVNGERVEGERILKDGDSVHFGSQKSAFMVVYEPLVLTASCLDAAVKKAVRQYMCTLGGHMVGEWQRDCSLLVMSKISVTIKVISALVSQKFIVTPQYIEAYKKHLQGLGEKPDPSKYTPELAETQLDGSEVSFDPDSRRKTLFEGMTFYFLSPKQLKKMNVAIELAGGMPLLLDRGKIDKSILKPGCVVMNCTDTELTQSSDTWVSDVQKLLDKHKKHMIMDAEIGFAVLYCSTEKHCNPDYISDADISRLPSQSLSQVEPFMADTETQDRSQKDSRSQRKGAKKDTQTVIDETKFGDDTGRTQTPRATQRDHDSRTQTLRTSQKQQVTQNEKSPVLPVVKLKDDPNTPSNTRSSKKRNRIEEEDMEVTEVISKRVKAEPVTPSKPQNIQSSASKTKDKKSSTSKAEDEEFIWDSDDDIDYSKIDTDVSIEHTEQRTSAKNKRKNSPIPENKQNKGCSTKSRSRSKSPAPKTSPAPRSRSPAPRSRSPAPRSRSPAPRSRSPAPRSKSPAPRSPAKKEDVVKIEPSTPTPKTSSRPTRKGQDSKNDKGQTEVKVENEPPSQTRSRQENIDEENFLPERRPKREEEEVTLYDRKSGLNRAEIPEGFLTTRQPIKDQVQRHQEYEKEDDLPVGCMHVETVSLIACRPARKETGAGDCPDGFTRWKGKVVRNYKKFKKTDHAGSQGLPNIIGGSDLEVHVAKRSKELDDWFRESVQAETEHTVEERRAQELFDFDPSTRRRGR